jgi:hypothetical protein
LGASIVVCDESSAGRNFQKARAILATSPTSLFNPKIQAGDSP